MHVMEPYALCARTFKAFCDENRLRVLELLRSGEKCACVLLEKLAIGQPTLSHHMKILTESGVVSARREGKWTYYSISADGARNAQKMLSKVLESFDGCSCNRTDGGCASGSGVENGGCL